MQSEPSRESFFHRGRLMSAKDIALEFFGDARREKWVRRTVAPKRRMRLGHSTVRWYERDVNEWFDNQRGKEGKDAKKDKDGKDGTA
jgi:hypothetical protein